MSEKELSNKYRSIDDLSISEFDTFTTCFQHVVERVAHTYLGFKTIDVNRIARKFHFVYETPDYSYCKWKYDSNDEYPNFQKTDHNEHLFWKADSNASVNACKFWFVYKLLCLYFFNDETALEAVYQRIRMKAIEQKKFYDTSNSSKSNSSKKQWEERYDEKFSVSSYTKVCLKSAFSEESGEGNLWKSPIYKFQTKMLGAKKIKINQDYFWIDEIRYKILLTTSSILGTAFYRTFDESKHKAMNALKEIDAKIDAFLERKEKELDHTTN